MTNRERIIGTLQCRATDRAPFGVGIGFAPWGETLDRWKTESGIADLNPWACFGYDADFATVNVEYGTWPHFPAKVLSEDAEFWVSTDYRGLTMRNRRDGGSMPEFLDNPVKNWEDWNRYKAERLQPAAPGRLAGLDDFAGSAATADRPIQVGKFPWGVFGTARDLLGAEELLISFYTQPDLVHDIMDTCTGLWLNVYAAVAAKIRIDHIHIWEDMSGKNGSLISMQMVEDFMMPCYDRIAAFARANAIPIVSVDSDGLVNELVPVMMKHGINAFLPFEVQAGNDMIEYRRIWPRLGMIGGLDKNVIADSAPEQAMHRELDKMEKLLASGGYIPGFDHLIPPNVPWKKWSFFMQAMKKMIGV